MSALFFFGLPLHSKAADISETKLHELAEGRYWQLLLHYQKSMFGRLRSLADGTQFFLSPQGKENPYEELIADIAAFRATGATAKEVGPLKQHPQCAFPERYRYLKKELQLKIADVRCPHYEEWQNRFNPAGATIVFASAYLSNPASMFGHTFLRIDSKPRPGNTQKNDLLDYGINYSAKTGNDGGITFAVLGLIGGYPGYFSLLPYFDKVKEYSDVESRDLWEYPLSLSKEQISRMIGHIWELGTTYFDYFFFDENCSYHLLSLLEVANPDWRFTDEFHYWVIPSDTVRVLKKTPGVLGQPIYRPSLQRRLQTRLDSMNSSERAVFEQSKKQDYAVPSTGGTAAVLEAVLDQQKYDQMRAHKNPDENDKAIERRLLIARSKDAAESFEPQVPESSNRPDIGVESAKLSAYFGRIRHSNYAGIQIRPVYHDVMDQDAGYQPFSEITLARTNLRYYFQAKRFRVHELQIAEVKSLVPSDELGSRISWSASGGLFSPSDLRCHHCTAFGLLGGAGESIWLTPKAQTAMAFALLRANIQYSGYFDDNFRFGPQAHAGFIAALSGRIKISATGDFNYYPTQDTKWSFEPAALFALKIKNDFELRLQSKWTATTGLHGFDHNGTFAWYF